MKKILAFVGSNRRKGTYESVEKFIEALNGHEVVEAEIIQLSKIHLESCIGCLACFDKGEDHCPLDDDRDKIIKKIDQADGIIFASPNYAFHVSAAMKNFIDRIAFIFHRPRYFEKAFTSIVTQGIHGGDKIRKYLDSTGRHIGFRVVKGCVINTLEPMTEKSYRVMEKKVVLCAKRFYKLLDNQTLPKPTLSQLMIFRLTRTGIQRSLVKMYDYAYFKEMGWFEAPYYYQIKLGFIKKLLGKLFDRIGVVLIRLMQ